MFKSGKECCICHDDILISSNDDIENIKKVDNKPTCDECYYENFGNLIEEMPIGIFIRRGPKT